MLRLLTTGSNAEFATENAGGAEVVKTVTAVQRGGFLSVLLSSCHVSYGLAGL